MKIALTLLLFAAAAFAERLTLSEAEAIALKNHPAIQAGDLDALASQERIAQSRAARFPSVTANLTSAASGDNTRLAAGAFNNPIIYTRVAGGFSVNQILYDFGRTANLVAGARASAAASTERVRLARAVVLLSVRRSYYAALRAERALHVASATIEARQLIVDQVTELVKGNLKSSLDQSFAETSLAEAKLLRVTIENERQAAYLDLAQALGRQSADPFELDDVALPVVESLLMDDLRKLALERRPELKALRLEADAARDLAQAERSSRFPAVTAMVGAGVVPASGPHLNSDYLAGAVNVSLPFMNGGLYKSRQAEAEIRARAIGRRIAGLENQVARDVGAALLDVNTALERTRLIERYVQQATQSFELAQSRYELGLSSIVELSQAQLAKTNAEIQYVTARYEYQLRRSILDYQTGSF